MAELTVNNIVEAGVVETLVAANLGGDLFVNENFDVFLTVDNGDTGAHVVTITPNQSTTVAPGFGTVDRDPIVVSIDAGESKLIGPFPQVFNDIAGKVNVAYDDVTAVTVGVFRLKAAR